mgnify:CR=1 FL=1
MICSGRNQIVCNLEEGKAARCDIVKVRLTNQIYPFYNLCIEGREVV